MKKGIIAIFSICTLLFVSTMAFGSTAYIPFWRARTDTSNGGNTIVSVVSTTTAGPTVTISLYASQYGSTTPSSANLWGSTSATLSSTAGAGYMIDTGISVSSWTTGTGYTTTYSWGTGNVTCSSSACVGVILVYGNSASTSIHPTGYSFDLNGGNTF